MVVVMTIIFVTTAPVYGATTTDLSGATDLELVARVIEAEAGNQPLEGMKAVGEVTQNRVESQLFPNSYYEVLFQRDDNGVLQYTTAAWLDSVTPSEAAYAAAREVLDRIDPVLPGPKDGKLVVFFSREGENEDVAAVIGDHVFCYSYWPEPVEE